MWFEDLMGFAEETPEQVRSHITLDGDRLTSHANGKTYGCGRLETPSLAELRSRAPQSSQIPPKAPTTLREVIADVQSLHTDPANAGALFQVASQFNLLEMTGPSVTPEQGVAIYQYDRTQGPGKPLLERPRTLIRVPGASAPTGCDAVVPRGTARKRPRT